MAEPRERSVTWPQVAAIIAAIGGIAAGHAYFVVPRVVQEARVEWTRDIDVALNAVRIERNAVYDGLVQRLTQIEARGVRLEDKVDTIIRDRR